MAQGFTQYNILDTEITVKDSPNLDAFSRLRVSNPLTIFSNQFTYDLSPLVFEEVTSDPVRCTAAHSSTDRMAVLSFAINTSLSDYIYMQSYEYIPYQPGRSQLVFVTFNMFPNGINNDSLKFAGLSDGTNGFEFQYDGGAASPAFAIYSSSNAGTQIVLQANWNLDKLDGTGPSGATLDLTKVQILVIDFQALYVGRVRMGFDINGTIVYCHEFLNANSTLVYPYIQTANLPVRAGMQALFASITDDMYFICCSVASEGGSEDAQRFGYNFTASTPVTAGATVLGYKHLLSVRPKTTFNAITNRTKFVLSDIEIINTGNKPAQWYIGIGAQLFSPTWNDVNLNYSAFEFDYSSGFTVVPQLILDSGYAPSGGGSKTSIEAEAIASKYPITLDAAGAQRDYGTISVAAEDIGGSTTLFVTLKWKEIR